MTRAEIVFLIATITAISGLIGIVLYDDVSPGRKITEENASRIKPGMTEREVQEILGGPPGDYRTREVEYGGLRRGPPWDPGLPPGWFGDLPRPPRAARVGKWTSNRAEVFVGFDEAGRAIGAYADLPAYELGPVESFLIRVGLREPRMICLN